MKRKRSGMLSFTLIEMLVVIAIIGVLAGMLFRLMNFLQRKSEKARCVALLERVGHGLNEYNAEYGRFPPVDFVAYEYENASNQTPWLCNVWLMDSNNFAKNPPKLFEYGLVAWLWLRDRGNIKHRQNEQWIDDTSRDESAKGRWWPFIDEVDLDKRPNGYEIILEGIRCPYSNDVATIKDPWGAEIHYVCIPPYLTYKLWSEGPDGENLTEDDIHYTSWDNL